MTDPDARLLAYADGELAAVDAADLERELADQPELRERLDEVRRFQERLRGGLPAAPTYDWSRRPALAAGLAFIANAGRVQRRWRAVRFAAAACLLVGMGMLAVIGTPSVTIEVLDGPVVKTLSLTPGGDADSTHSRYGFGWDSAGAPVRDGKALADKIDREWQAIGDGNQSITVLNEAVDGLTVRHEDALESDKQPKERHEAREGGDPRDLMMGRYRSAAQSADQPDVQGQSRDEGQGTTVHPESSLGAAAVVANLPQQGPIVTETMSTTSPRGEEKSVAPVTGRRSFTGGKKVGPTTVAQQAARETEITGPQAIPAPPTSPARACKRQASPRLPITTNPWTLAERDARSTFALDTDRASYALTRRHLDAGTLPPPDTVRVEEFVNAFDYHDHAPEVDTFALRAEAAPAPFCRGATLLRLGVKGRVAGRDGRRPAHLVLVVDGSGSMDRPDRGAVAKAGLIAALGALAPDDRVTVIAFAEEARLLAEALPATDPALARALGAIPAQGASNLAGGLALGYAQAARAYRPGAVNRVVLVSDGIANLGETGLDQLVAAAEANRRLGIATTTVGVGAGNYDDALLARLAKRGDGHYLRLDSDADSRVAFVADLGAGLRTIAADAKIQVTFDPARVRRWRLLGYEQRALAHEDFANDAVDAGEVGSGQAATALYEVELIGDAGSDLGSVHLRSMDPAAGAVKELSWRLAGDLPRPRSVSEAPGFHLAAAAAEFAELLRGSEHAADGTFPALIALLERVAAVWPHDAAVADLLRLARAAPGLPPAP